MTLNGVMAVKLRYFTKFGSLVTNDFKMAEDSPILSATEMWSKESSF